MKVTTEMYTTLFNAITDARRKLDEVTEILDKAQLITEEIYINNEDETIKENE